MKRIALIALAILSPLAARLAPLSAANTKTTVAQVSNAVSLTTDVDYTITDATTPFASAGSVDIVNTEHAVVIFQNIKPSVVISRHLGNVYINGEKAVNDDNCQVKMFAQGSIVLPYGKDFKPLTCYTEANFGGESYDGYTLGNSGGFMLTLSSRTLNNQIRSFKLKRGYMVTFAVGTGGWGYSRCFIADLEDLEVPTLPNVLNGKISSYRIFKWQNAQKKGLASNGNQAANAALNTSWCYDWGQGNASLLPDQEWVPNHIYEDWPSAATCGSVTQSCHMKTNNEPGNSADDHPQDVATVLGNWQNLMRTGMRLCSESSHDGSMNHLKAFIDSIDARGWRCDILDLHCYWSGGFNNLTWYSDYYGNGRPIWISEWIWGASWNRNGAFGTDNETTILNETKNILTTLNNNSRVERYAYWNSESKAHIYENGRLTTLGQYYASMESGLAYNKANEYIPRVVYKAPGSVKGTYTKNKSTFALEWTDPNGDMLDSIVVEWKTPGTTRWAKRGDTAPKDKTSSSDVSYTYTDTLSAPEPGIYAYRVVEYYDGGKKYTSNEASLTISAGASSVGNLQYGQLRIGSDESVTTEIETQEKAPYIVVGLVSNKNAANGITNQVQSIGKSNFRFRFYPWQLKTPVNFSSAETADYLILPPDTIFHLSDQMMLISQKAGNIRGEEVEVVFPEAFPEGVIPVVVAQQNTTVSTYAPVTVRVYDVTNTGFKARLVRQEGVSTAFNGQNVNYFAATPGQVAIGQGKLLTVGRDNDTPCGGSARQTIVFRDAAGDTLHLLNPYIIAAPQTHNYEKASILRQHSTTSDSEGRIVSASIRRQVDDTSTVTTTNNARNNGDYIGWFIISDDPQGTGDELPLISPVGIEGLRFGQGFNVSVEGRAIHAGQPGVAAYTLSGSQVRLGQPLPAGIYVVTDGRTSLKVQVR